MQLQRRIILSEVEDDLRRPNIKVMQSFAYLTTGERRARAHRLITRGAAIESILPVTQPMTERAFYELMETVLTLPIVQSIIQSRLPQTDDDP